MQEYEFHDLHKIPIHEDVNNGEILKKSIQSNSFVFRGFLQTSHVVHFMLFLAVN